MRAWAVLLIATAAGFGQAALSGQAMDECEARRVYARRNGEAMSLWPQKQWAKAIAILEELEANAAVMRIPEFRADVRYNLACGYSLVGNKDKALARLRELVAETTINPQRYDQDSDFDNIRHEPAFQEALAEMRTRWKQTGSFWDSPAMKTPYRENLSEDEKIAGLARFWSEVKYNFAWFERLQGLDWDATYLEYLPKVRASASTLEYYRLLQRMCALLKDAHTNVSPPSALDAQLYSHPPLRLTLVEGRVLVARVTGPELEQAGVRRGVEVVGVDGLAVRAYADQFVLPYVSASSDQDRLQRGLAFNLLAGAAGSSVRVQFLDESGHTFERTVTRVPAAERIKAEPASSRNDRFSFRMLDPEVAYVALDSFGDGAIVKDFADALPQIEKAAALIIDVRSNGGGNSGYGTQILGYLTSAGGPVEAVRTRLYRPAYRAWNMGEGWHDQTWSTAPHGSKPYRGKVILLTSPRTFSAAEDFAVGFDMLKIGTILGEPTGGSTGQPLSFPLPGGGSARVCTLQTRYADGRDFVGVGVQPHIRVTPTVEDFRAGRDTVLEAARAQAQLRAAR